MRVGLFLSSFYAMAVVSPLSAEVYTVGSASEFESAWNRLVEGDSMIVSGTINVSAAGLESHAFKVVVSSVDGGMLTWAEAGGAAPLPADVEYQGLYISGAPAPVLLGGVIGEGNVFASNNNGVVATTEMIRVMSGNSFISNYAAADGGVISVTGSGSVEVSGGCSFRYNFSAGRGGAIFLSDVAQPDEDFSAVMDASEADIFFKDNAESVVVSGGSVVNPGYSNDLYLGSGRAVHMIAGEGHSIELASGLASSDDTSRIVKSGTGTLFVGDAECYAGALRIQEGQVVLGENNSWGRSVASGGVIVERGGSFVLQSGATLSQDIELRGGDLVIHQGAVLNAELTASAASCMVVALTPERVTQAPGNPWLTIASEGALAASAAEYLTLTLDMTAFGGDEEGIGNVFLVDFSQSQDADTMQRVQSMQVTWTDARGVHGTDVRIGDDGMLDLSAILAALAEDEVLVTGTNAMLGSMDSCRWLLEASRSTVPNAVAVDQSSLVWGTALGGHSRHSGSASDYNYSGMGYAIGIDTKLGEHTDIGLTCGQVIGSGKSKNTSLPDSGMTVDQVSYMLGVYGRHSYVLAASQRLVVDAFAGYASVDNELDTAPGKVDWRDDVFVCAARLTWQQTFSGNVHVSPFVGIEYATVSQGNYTARDHAYSDGQASLLSLPFGVSIAKEVTECGQKAVIPYVSFAFVPHLSCDDPEADVQNVHGARGKSQGIDFERFSYRVQGGVRVEWDDRWSTNIGAGVQADSSHSEWHVTASAGYFF